MDSRRWCMLVVWFGWLSFLAAPPGYGAGVQSFSITHVELQFLGGRQSLTVNLQKELKAVAVLTVKGKGTVEAKWQIATPPSTGGLPVFRNLRIVRHFVGKSGEVELTSPLLPTDQPGVYLLRMSLGAKLPSLKIPELRYHVSGR